MAYQPVRNLPDLTEAAAALTDEFVVERQDWTSLDRAIFAATRGCGPAPEATRLIPLTKGFFAVVDDADFEGITAVRWRAQVDERRVYACRQYRIKKTPKVVFEAMHRVIAETETGVIVDHRNGIGLDNRRNNLRSANIFQNSHNTPPHKGRQFKGTYFCQGRKSRPYFASIVAAGRTYRLGSFATETEAAKAYDAAARLHHGAFAYLNFPNQEDAARSCLHELESEPGGMTCVRGVLRP